MDGSKFRILLADPPWAFNSRAPNSESRFGGGAAGHYPVMSVAEICALNVRALAADRSVCCMWVTGSHMEAGYKVLRSWGFKPVKPIFVWVKTTPKGKLYMGPGYYTASNAEYILLGTRGQPWHANRKTVGGPGLAVPEVVMAPHPREMRQHPKTGKLQEFIKHSAKPPIFRDHIVRLFGDLPRVELFARETAPGWVAIGNQLADNPLELVPHSPDVFAPTLGGALTDNGRTGLEPELGGHRAADWQVPVTITLCAPERPDRCLVLEDSEEVAV